MIAILKFGASWILPPGIFFVIFLVISWYAYRRHQTRLAGLIALTTFIFYLASTTLVGGALIGSLEAKYTPPSTLPRVDAIVVLGGGAISDTPDVSGTGTLTSIPANRLLTAVRLQQKLQVPILVSGGEIYKDSGKEADIARRILLDLDVPEKSIILENKSLNTTQNALYSSRILKARGYHHILLVTSAFHMPRAMINFEQVGIDATAYPTDFMVNRNRYVHLTKLSPSSQALEFTAIYFQEKLRTFITRYLE